VAAQSPLRSRGARRRKKSKQLSRSSASCDRVRSRLVGRLPCIALSHGLPFAAYVEQSQYEVVVTGLIDITGWRRSWSPPRGWSRDDGRSGGKLVAALEGA